MLYNYDSYKLYLLDGNSKGSARVKVTMKEEVDPDILSSSVNVAIKRYPYFAVYLSVDSKGGLVLSYNDSRVAVIKTSEQMPMLGERLVNGHLLYLDYRGKNIYFNISHALAGVRGYMPFVFTTVYEYVRECFGKEPFAPMVNKPESPILPGELVVPNMEMIRHLFRSLGVEKRQCGLVLFEDIFKEHLSPTKRSHEYRTYEFDEEPVLEYARANHTTVAGVFLMLQAKALDNVVSDRDTPLCGGIVHNPLVNWGLPLAHSDVETHVLLEYNRELLRGDTKKLGEYTKAELKRQTKPEYTGNLFRRYLELIERIDGSYGLNAKRWCARTGMLSVLPSSAVTYIVSYGGIVHMGELEEYVESFYNIIEGNMTLSLTARDGKIFAAFMQSIREEKYVNALNEAFHEAGFIYQMSGPFRQHLPAHNFTY